MKISNYDKIKVKNNSIKRNFLTYEKALLLIQSGKKVKGYLMMLTVYDVYLKRNNIKKRVKKKIKKIFSVFWPTFYSLKKVKNPPML